MPTISVIMSVYKEPLGWIQESIDSILHQTFNDFEFIVIDDNPADKKLYSFLEKNKNNDARIKVIYNETNIGLTKSLNKGLELAKGRYIARMDADDISCSSRFERQISFLESNPHIGVCGSSIEFFGTKEGIVEYPIQEKDIYLFLETCFAHPTVMIRSSVLESNKYNENIRVSQDFDLWTTLYGKGVHFSNLKEPLLRYRCSDIQITATKAKLQAEVSRNIRRRAFDDYCRIHGFDLVLSGKDLSYGLIVEINKKLSLPKSVSQDLNYYLLSSIDDNCLRMFLNIVVKGFLFKLKWYDILRLLYHTTTNRQPFMF